MTTELEGRVGLVTGGTSGIGRDTAILFAKAGAKVVVAGRREAEGNETIDLIHAACGEGLFVKADVSKTSDVEMLVRKTVETFGRLDIAFIMPGSRAVGHPSPSNPKKTGIAPSTSISKAFGYASSTKFVKCLSRAVVELS